jgi:SAM-dependent methyltransferase
MRSSEASPAEIEPRRPQRAASKHSRLAGRYKWAFAWLPQSGIVLDIGSSTSPLHWVLHEKAEVAVAIDIDHSALQTLKDSAAPVHPVEASSSMLPIRSASVDAVLLLDVLEHVNDEDRTILEIHRVLRPGGTLVLSVPHQGLFRFLDPQNIRAWVDGALTPLTMHRHYSQMDLLHLLGMRFRIVRAHYGGLFLCPLTFAGDNFVRKHLRWDWGRVFKALSDFDNDISWGRLSYNVIMLAEKI